MKVEQCEIVDRQNDKILDTTKTRPIRSNLKDRRHDSEHEKFKEYLQLMALRRTGSRLDSM